MSRGPVLPMTQERFIAQHQKKRRQTVLLRLLILLLFIGLWELTTRLDIIDAFIFSSPSRVCATFWTMILDGSLFYHLAITLAETFAGFFLVMIFGILIAMGLWWNPQASAVLEPYLVTLNSLPKTALAPILIVWLGNNVKTIIVCAVSLAIFSTIINLYTSFSQTDRDKLLLIQTLGGTKKDMLTRVVIPGNVPNIMSNMKVNIGLCLVGVIIGEFLAANAGLGYLIIYGSQVFRLDHVIMSIVILCIVAAGLYGLLSIVERRYLKGMRQ